MNRSSLAVGLMIGLAIAVVPAFAETYYVMPGSTVDFDANYSFSVSGYLKLVIFPEDGWLDWLNPKANAYGGIYAYTTAPGTVTGTFDASEANSELTISGMELDLLSGQPQAMTAGATLHSDGIPSAVIDLLHTFLGQYLTIIDPNILDPNIIWDVIGAITAGFDFQPALAASLTELNMSKTGDPVVALLDANGAFTNVWMAANVDSTIRFGDPNTILSDPNGFDVPAIPIAFPIAGQYTGDPVGAVTFSGSVEPNGWLTTPNIVLFDQVVALPIGPNSINVNFHLHLQVDDGHAGIKFDPTITTLSGYLVTTEASPADAGSITLDPPGPKFAPGATVTVTATAVEGMNFLRWEGDLAGSANPATITMNGHKHIRAIFVPDVHLELTWDPNLGDVAASPAGPNYPPNTVVTLTAVPHQGFSLDKWEGDLSGMDNPITINMNGDKTVHAVFVKEFFWLTLAEQGSGFIAFVGDGYLDPNNRTTRVKVEALTSIRLNPMPSGGWVFKNWIGAPAGHETDNPLDYPVTGPATVTAVFEKTGSCGTGLALPMAAALVCMGVVAAVRRRS
jgi:hypothetical protein